MSYDFSVAHALMFMPRCDVQDSDAMRAFPACAGGFDDSVGRDDASDPFATPVKVPLLTNKPPRKAAAAKMAAPPGGRFSCGLSGDDRSLWSRLGKGSKPGTWRGHRAPFLANGDDRQGGASPANVYAPLRWSRAAEQSCLLRKVLPMYPVGQKAFTQRR
jgi:hypothetical protein